MKIIGQISVFLINVHYKWARLDWDREKSIQKIVSLG